MEHFGITFDVDELNKRFDDKTNRRVEQILRLNGFKECKESKVPQLTRLKHSNGYQAMRFTHNNVSTLIKFSEGVVVDKITPHLDDSGHGLNGFIVEQGDMYFLYKVSKDFGQTGRVEKIENGEHGGGFLTEESLKQAILLCYER